MPPTFSIGPLTRPITDGDLSSLADLLVEAVHGGAAVSFLMPLSREFAKDWWAKTGEGLQERGVILVARDASASIIGTVQLQPAWAPNQSHRAEVCKLIVRHECRGLGVGQALMNQIERSAAANGFTLLTLDAREGGAAERLFERLNWRRVGVIPGFAVNPEGNGTHGTVIFYKSL